ncbi:MAG: glycosyltransferase family 2 protein [Armatimonadota bacterium]|nr:glycosyltransferase family 2 protein [Armatimonadota bacterium]
MDLSISIVSWNTRDVLDQCLESVYATVGGTDFEVIVVDNASSDGSADMVSRKYPQATLIRNTENRGFTAANNQALEIAQGRYFLLLNPDTICKPGALVGLVKFLDDNPRCGAVGPMVLNPDGSLQYSWARFPTFWNEARGKLDRRINGVPTIPKTPSEVRALGAFRVDWVGGCCLMARRDAIDQVGPMDESLFMYCEETDWCKRFADAGWEVWVEPAAEIIHFGGQSSAQVVGKAAGLLRRSKRRYFEKHCGRYRGLVLWAVLSVRSLAKRVLNG